MIKKYKMFAMGEIQQLRDALMGLEGVRVGCLDNYISASINESDPDSYRKTEQLFKLYAKQYQFEYDYAFDASDYTSEDLNQADAIITTFPTFGVQHGEGLRSQLTVENKGFTSPFICEHCHKEIPSWDGSGTLILSSAKKFSYPFFGTHFGGAVFRQDIMEILRENRLDSDLSIKECDIKSKKTIAERYYAIFPKVDLGEPVGDIEFLAPCPICHDRNLRHKREFLWPYKKELFDGLNFARTSWYSIGRTIISARVYSLLQQFPEAQNTEDVRFKPIALI